MHNCGSVVFHVASKPVGFVSAAHLVQSGSALQGAGTLDGSSFLHKHAGNKTNSLRKEDKADAYEASLFLKSLRMLSERFAADNGVVTASSSSGPRELGNASVMAVRCFLDAIEGGDLSLAGTPAIKCMGPSSKSGGATSNPFGGSDGGKVTLGTIHKAKGLEWNHVFVVGCSEGGYRPFGEMMHYWRSLIIKEVCSGERAVDIARRQLGSGLPLRCGL